MVTYYKIGDMFCASAHGDLPYEKTEKPAAGTTLTWLFTGEPGSRRASFLVNHPAELFMEKEDVSWLNTNRLNASAYDGQTRELPADLLAQLDAGTLRAVNASHPKFEEILAYELTKLVHSEEEAKKAQESARALFGAGAGDGSDAPVAELSEEDFKDGQVDILTIVHKAGLAASRSEARRNVQQGGVTVDGEKVTDIAAAYTREQLQTGLLVKRGKKNFKKVIVK